jgi:outer membrane protein TolC
MAKKNRKNGALVELGKSDLSKLDLSEARDLDRQLLKEMAFDRRMLLAHVKQTGQRFQALENRVDNIEDQLRELVGEEPEPIDVEAEK